MVNHISAHLIIWFSVEILIDLWNDDSNLNFVQNSIPQIIIANLCIIAGRQII